MRYTAQTADFLGSPTVKIRGGFIQRCVAILRLWEERSRYRKGLARIEARTLQDFGMTEVQRYAECRKPFWRS